MRTLDFELQQEHAQRAKRLLDVTYAVLRQPRWVSHPVRQDLMDRAVSKYCAVARRLQAQARVEVEAARAELAAAEKDRRQHLLRRQEEALRGVSLAAYQDFRDRLGRMTPAELLSAYQDGQDWHRITIEGHADLEPKPDGRGIFQTPEELTTLQRLIETEPKSYAFESVVGLRNVTIASQRDLDADAARLAAAERQIDDLDPVQREISVRNMFGLQDDANSVTFPEEEMKAAAADLAGSQDLGDWRQVERLAGITA